MENLPKHIAIIPDGNRRWAKRKGLPVWEGHRVGAKNFEKIAKAALDMGLFCLTFWGGSYDNLTKRPETELKFLKEIYRVNFSRLLKNKDIFREQARVNIFGHWRELLNDRIKRPMEKIIEKTKDHNNKFFNFLIGYNGTHEMINAIQLIVSQVSQDKNLKVTPELIKNNLWTRDLPSVDLVIRTGLEGDPHWSSGFMMWDTADSQFYFTDTNWPEFSEAEFKKAVENYGKRERRLGA